MPILAQFPIPKNVGDLRTGSCDEESRSCVPAGCLLLYWAGCPQVNSLLDTAQITARLRKTLLCLLCRDAEVLLLILLT